MNIETIVATQREFYATGITKSLPFRRRALQRLYGEISASRKDLQQALQADLGKAPTESYMTEIGMVLDEIRYLLRHFASWAQDTHVYTPLAQFPARSFVRREPYGVALVIAPWNYPLLLSINPLVGAIAAGNCVVLKPSAYAPATSAVLAKLVRRCFRARHATVVQGGRAENTALLEQRFDTILFTGSVEVGKIVMGKAAKNLTPVTLELGGKSPCIVDKTANLRLAGKRIAFGKWLNAGQTCVAPDYLLVHSDVKEELIQHIITATQQFFGDDPLQSSALPKIVNQKHFERLKNLMANQTIVYGGNNDAHQRIAPTLLDNVSPDSAIMQEEIFGPILPILTFNKLDEAISFVNAGEKPLALYLFTRSPHTERRVLSRCSFGGGCINDTIVHLATSHLGFGGVGHSGMGSYHGKKSLATFSHEKGILKKSNLLDLPMRYHPHTPWKTRIIETILR